MNEAEHRIVARYIEALELADQFIQSIEAEDCSECFGLGHRDNGLVGTPDPSCDDCSGTGFIVYSMDMDLYRKVKEDER